jgi:hypothetical protein
LVRRLSTLFGIDNQSERRRHELQLLIAQIFCAQIGRLIESYEKDPVALLLRNLEEAGTLWRQASRRTFGFSSADGRRRHGGNSSCT